MPFIIEIKSPRSTARSANGRALANFEKRTTPDYDVMSRRAVATLDGERETALEIVAEHASDEDQRDAATVALTLPETGGTIGPMPDGTVIEVRPTTWRDLCLLARLNWGSYQDPCWHTSHGPIITVYNAMVAAQAVTS